MKSAIVFLLMVITAPFVTAQQAGKSAVVAATNMNVLYSGVENPVAIAVPGVNSENVTAAVSDGTIRKNGDGWEIITGNQKILTVTVFASGQKVSETRFRVLRIPVPVAKFAGKNEGSLSKSVAAETVGLEAALDNFVWDLKFTIASFRMSYLKGGYMVSLESKSFRLTPEMQKSIEGLNPEDKISFEDIMAVGPDGKLRRLNDIVLKIQ